VMRLWNIEPAIKRASKNTILKDTQRRKKGQNGHTCFQRKDYQSQSCQCQDQGFKSICKEIVDQTWKE
jgi:hypothetical protein